MALKSRAFTIFSKSIVPAKSSNIDKWKSAARAAADVIEKAWDFVSACRYGFMESLE